MPPGCWRRSVSRPAACAPRFSAPAAARGRSCGPCCGPARPRCGCGTAPASAPSRSPGSSGRRAVEHPRPADLLVNCTALELPREGPERPPRAPAAPLEPSATGHPLLNQVELKFDQVGRYPYVVDLAYSPGGTELLTAARAHGAHTVDGTRRARRAGSPQPRAVDRPQRPQGDHAAGSERLTAAGTRQLGQGGVGG